MRGRVKWFNNVKGYGFIVPDVPGRDVFFHYPAIEGGKEARDKLVEGTLVEFEQIERPIGPAAEKVRVSP